MFKKIWKTFCNTDIIGKIYMLIILFIIVVAIVTVIVRYANAGKKEEQQVNEDVVNITESPQVDIAENVDTTLIEENSDITEEVVETNEEVKSTTIVSATPVVKSVNEVKKVTSSSEVKNTTDNKAQEVIQEPVIDITNDKNNNQEADIPTNIPTSKPKEEGAKYVVNNQMINTIKTYIENNPTEDMLNFGYTVQVDSSIKELTNPFTYTEKRVKALINLKFGTIRIYAEDYYYDGEYVTTYSYVI